MPDADLLAQRIAPAPDGIAFDVSERDGGDECAVQLAGARPAQCRQRAGGAGRGARRRRAARRSRARRSAASPASGGGWKWSARASGVTVIDDFAHNPDKIAATLATLHDFPGRLLVMFQPHGFGPLQADAATSSSTASPTISAQDDVLVMPEPVYFGGTTDRSVTSDDIAAGVARARPQGARASPTARPAATRCSTLAKPGDRIVVMGARDDTLSTFAGELLRALA